MRRAAFGCVVWSDDLDVFNPSHRDCGVVQVAEAIGVFKAVLCEDDVFSASKYSDKHAPASHWDIDDSPVGAGFSYACVSPHATY